MIKFDLVTISGRNEAFTILLLIGRERLQWIETDKKNKRKVISSSNQEVDFLAQF